MNKMRLGLFFALLLIGVMPLCSASPVLKVCVEQDCAYTDDVYPAGWEIYLKVEDYSGGLNGSVEFPSGLVENLVFDSGLAHFNASEEGYYSISVSAGESLSDSVLVLGDSGSANLDNFDILMNSYFLACRDYSCTDYDNIFNPTVDKKVYFRVLGLDNLISLEEFESLNQTFNETNPAPDYYLIGGTLLLPDGTNLSLNFSREVAEIPLTIEGDYWIVTNLSIGNLALSHNSLFYAFYDLETPSFNSTIRLCEGSCSELRSLFLEGADVRVFVDDFDEVYGEVILPDGTSSQLDFYGGIAQIDTSQLGFYTVNVLVSKGGYRDFSQVFEFEVVDELYDVENVSETCGINNYCQNDSIYDFIERYLESKISLKTLMRAGKQWIELTGNFNENPVPEDCTEDWYCSNWSSCFNNSMTRMCTDLNSCGTIFNRPSLNQSCASQTQNSSIRYHAGDMPSLLGNSEVCNGEICTYLERYNSGNINLRQLLVYAEVLYERADSSALGIIAPNIYFPRGPDPYGYSGLYSFNEVDYVLFNVYSAPNSELTGCWMEINGETINIEKENCLRSSNYYGGMYPEYSLPVEMSRLVEGENTITLYIDSKKGVGYATTTFIIDTTPPVVNITYPLARAYNEEVNLLRYSIDYYDVPDYSWGGYYYPYSSMQCAYSTGDAEPTDYEWRNCESFWIGADVGENKWNVFVRDAAGNIGSSSVEFEYTALGRVVTFENAGNKLIVNKGDDKVLEIFSTQDVLSQISVENLAVIEGEVNNNSYLLVRDLDPSWNLNKTVYLKAGNNSGVCFRDEEVEDLNSVMSNCTYLECPGDYGGYACSIEDENFAVSGLRHSGLIVINGAVCGDHICVSIRENCSTCPEDCGMCNITQPGIANPSESSSGGGSGGSSSSSSASQQTLPQSETPGSETPSASDDLEEIPELTSETQSFADSVIEFVNENKIYVLLGAGGLIVLILLVIILLVLRRMPKKYKIGFQNSDQKTLEDIRTKLKEGQSALDTGDLNSARKSYKEIELLYSKLAKKDKSMYEEIVRFYEKVI